MGTTALFAELVVGGVLTLTWMLLLVMAALGPSHVTSLAGATPISTGFLLAVAYALGVVFDRVWDFLLDVTNIQSWLRGQPKAVENISETDRQRRRVFGADPKTAVAFINYHRSRMRVARASLFNFILITISGLVLLGVRYGGIATSEFALTGFGGALLCVASALALWKLGRTHDRVLDILSPETDTPSPALSSSAEEP